MRKINLTRKPLMLPVVALILAMGLGCGDDPAPEAIAAFDFTATTEVVGQAPLNVQFTNNSENAVSFAWDFGDGNSSTEEAPLHIYEKGGVYSVKLTVTNSDGMESVDEGEIELASPLVGTWVLDSAAENTIDSLAIKVMGSMEFGDKEGWDGESWLAIANEEEGIKGYSTFWSNLIFSGNYLGRKTFFNNEFSFAVDGSFQRDLKGSMPGLIYFSPESEDLSESESWKDANGQSLDAYKSNMSDYTYAIKASSEYADKKLGEITMSGLGSWCGIYFAGNAIGSPPQDSYTYTIVKVTDQQLILTGVNNLFGNDAVIFVLKFKKVQ